MAILSIVRLFDLTTKFGYERALDSLTHKNEKTISNMWKASTKDYYFHLLKDTIEKPVGKKIIHEKLWDNKYCSLFKSRW